MIAGKRVLELLQESFDSIYRSGLVKDQTRVNDDTVLLGNGSTVDSIAFVTLVADFEDRLDRENGQPIYIVLSDIHNFNPSKSSLSAGTLAQYIAGQQGE